MKGAITLDNSSIEMLGARIYSGGVGEVVLRELIQNSIDSGAKNLDVTLEDSGENYILSVLDDGVGIDSYQEQFLKVGGSSKKDHSQNPEAIGGFGIAKLAMLSCEKLEIISTSGSLVKNSIEDFDIDSEDSLDAGTLVTVEFPIAKAGHQFKSFINQFLQLINRDIVIFFNNEYIGQCNTTPMYIGKKSYETFVGCYNTYGRIFVRVNGMVTLAEYQYNLSSFNIIYDIKTDKSPADSDYPVPATRDCINRESQHYDIFMEFKNNLSKTLEEDKRLEEVKKSLITERDGVLLGQNATKGMTKNKCFKLFKRYIEQIIKQYSCHLLSEYKFGVTSDETMGACYSPAYKGFLISTCSLACDKSEILSMAMHEYAHSVIDDNIRHDQIYAYELTKVTSKVLRGIANKTFKF